MFDFMLKNIKKQPTFIPQFEYNESELLALSLGYEEVIYEKAYRGRYFIKNNKKWIHNIGVLRKTLTDKYGRYIDDSELAASEPEGFGYDVEAYYQYQCKTSIFTNNKFQALVKATRLH